MPAATSFGLLANYLFWRWLRCSTWQRAPAAGIGLGIALMSKTTWLVMFVLWPILCCARLLALHRGSAAGSCCGARSGAAAFGSLDELAVLAPAAALLALVCWQTGFTRYLRYLLPAFPYAFIWTSGALTDLTRYRGSWGMRSVAFFLAWSISSSLWYSPHWISYFNEFTGGPAGGPSWVIDAQVDWGQDLLYLQDHIATTTHAEALRFAYFGAIDPRIAGIRFQLPPRATTVMTDRSLIAPVPHDLVPGLYAVSVNCLYGYPCVVDDGQGGEAFLDRAYYSYFRRFKPDSTAGYSIYIYNLSADDIATEFAAARTVPTAPPPCAAVAD